MRASAPASESLRRFGPCGSPGFTLLEFMAFMVFAGFVLIATLKSIDMIDLAKAMRGGRSFQEVHQAVMVYQDQYGELPGDDPGAPERFGRPYSILVSNDIVIWDVTNNQTIDGYLMDPAMPNDEQYSAWRDLRFANLWPGDSRLQGPKALPENVFGGIIGFDVSNLGIDGAVCMTHVPGKAARSIDENLDDGKMPTGDVRATSRYNRVTAANHFEAPDPGEYIDDRNYILCTKVLP